MVMDVHDVPGNDVPGNDEELERLLHELAAELDLASIVAEEEVAARRLAAIEAGRRKGGAVGAAMAGVMFVLREIYQGPPKDEIAVVAESPGEPGDIDVDGIDIDGIDGNRYWAPPPG